MLSVGDAVSVADASWLVWRPGTAVLTSTAGGFWAVARNVMRQGGPGGNSSGALGTREYTPVLRSEIENDATLGHPEPGAPVASMVKTPASTPPVQSTLLPAHAGASTMSVTAASAVGGEETFAMLSVAVKGWPMVTVAGKSGAMTRATSALA